MSVYLGEEISNTIMENPTLLDRFTFYDIKRYKAFLDSGKITTTVLTHEVNRYYANMGRLSKLLIRVRFKRISPRIDGFKDELSRRASSN